MAVAVRFLDGGGVVVFVLVVVLSLVNTDVGVQGRFERGSGSMSCHIGAKSQGFESYQSST